MRRSFVRKPSLKKSFSAKTTGRAKRSLKRAINPAYGKKGMGAIRNPKRSAYNAVYHRTSTSVKNNGGCGCLLLLAALIVLFIIVL